EFDLAIVGAGPAGATCALYAARAGLRVALLDRECFPRDKVCGDVIPRKGVQCLQELGLLDALHAVPHVRAGGVVFSSPNGTVARVPFAPAGHALDGYVCYVCRRLVFDEILFAAASRRAEAHQGLRVEDLIVEGGRVCGVTGTDPSGRPQEIRARVVVGADGFRSIVARRTGLYRHDPAHWAVATRAYYRGVGEVTDAIEVHFVDDILPGYFWIFPLDGGLVNVGLGMRHDELRTRGIRLRDAHVAATQSPFFRQRFASAELVGPITGWNLPLGSRRRPVHGDGFVLLGDAAGLVNPFSGEGIGNAMWSGRIAAEVLARACGHGDLSARGLHPYAVQLWAEVGPALKTSHALQRLGRVRPLLNLVIDRAAQNPEVRDWVAGMMAGVVPKKVLRSPLTWVRLLLA
ncbi:MAG: geranylgeranyl reductase family protein, partial [Candidatus Latescibacterota bacterium]